jgi:hypothetical protein
MRSYVHAGTRTRDWLFVSDEDATSEFVALSPRYHGWWVLPGDWWADHFGKDADDAA